MQAIVVGKLYQKGVNQYSEGVHYNFDKAGHILHLFIKNPTASEINNIKKGEIYWNFLVYPECLFLLIKFGSLPWFDAPYSWWIVPKQRRIVPKLEEHELFTIQIILINATTGIVEAIRLISLPKIESQTLLNIIQFQIENPISPEAYHRRIDQIYQLCPTSEAMIKLIDKYNNHNN